ncbi:ExbD/TolR family protein [Rhodoferax sp.]|uniref:ExbD/TolR family protein n=1 Tax=Rhodoferax sp. TaxID=50421 RepID=UPI00274D6678|nr:biopolymer transporter ExbD [Rhodoferax sp.]
MAIDFEAVGEGDEGMLSDINTTPLVDVMLVLLIIFLITIPVINTSVAVKLPKQVNQLQQSRPETMVITVDASGATYLFDTKLSNAQALQERLARIAGQNPQPEVHIRGDARANYEAVARVLYACQQAGITRIGFVTEPPPLN